MRTSDRTRLWRVVVDRETYELIGFLASGATRWRAWSRAWPFGVSSPRRSTRYLVAYGAAGDYRPALFADNDAGWYVDEDLAKAAEYRAAAPLEPGGDAFGRLVPPESQTVPETLHNRRITLTAIQRSDVRSGTLDPRGATPA